MASSKQFWPKTMKCHLHEDRDFISFVPLYKPAPGRSSNIHQVNTWMNHQGVEYLFYTVLACGMGRLGRTQTSKCKGFEKVDTNLPRDQLKIPLQPIQWTTGLKLCSPWFGVLPVIPSINTLVTLQCNLLLIYPPYWMWHQHIIRTQECY